MIAISKAPEKQEKLPIQRPLTVLLYAEIRKEYTRMKNIKNGSAQLYHGDFIIQQVAKKFFKSPKTIENIIFNRV